MSPPKKLNLTPTPYGQCFQPCLLDALVLQIQRTPKNTKIVSSALFRSWLHAVIGGAAIVIQLLPQSTSHVKMHFLILLLVLIPLWLLVSIGLKEL